MSRNTKIVIGTLAVLVSVGLWIAGIVPYDFNLYYAVSVAALIGAWLWPRQARSPALDNLLLLFLSIGVALICTEFAMRTPLGPDFYRKETMVATFRYPRMPLVSRFRENGYYRGMNYGNLSAMSGIKEYREMRPFVFRTDAFGFRNDPWDPQGRWDAILLGDSFGVGAETSQEDTRANIL